MQQDRDQERGTEASPLSLISQSTASAFADARASFERFCLAAGIEAMEALLEDEATSICGCRHRRDAERAVYRWGTAMSPVGFHDGKVGVRRPRLRGKDGGDVPLASFADLQQGDLLQDWAYELMSRSAGAKLRRSGMAGPTFAALRLQAGIPPSFRVTTRESSEVVVPLACRRTVDGRSTWKKSR